jgi:hypothetical protein
MRVYDYSSAYRNQMGLMLRNRKLPEKVIADLPATGVIVLDDQLEPVASGFLRLIEGDFALVDGFLSNIDFTKQERSHALDLVCRALLAKAAEMGLHALFVTTFQDVIEQRALQFGFKIESQIKVLSYSLTEGAGICHF